MHNAAGDVFETYARANENRGILDGSAIERRDPKNAFTIYENEIFVLANGRLGIFTRNISTG